MDSLSFDQIEELLPYLSPEERATVDTILASDRALMRPLPGPQSLAYASEADITGFGGAAGGGKANHINDLALTPKGWRRMGEIAPGDAVIDPTTGGACEVVAVWPQGEQDIYEIETDDGAKCRVVDWHLWAYKPNGRYNRRPGTKRSAQRAFAKANLGASAPSTRWDTLRVGTTLDLKTQVERGRNPRLPLMEPALFTVNGRTGAGMDPYLLGTFLGDGCTADNSVTTADEETAEYLETQGLRKVPSSAFAWRAVGDVGKRLRQWLSDHGLSGSKSWTKFVPPYVLTASIGYRLAFLQGLMDTDGTVDKRGRCYFISTSRELATGVQALARSLGGKASLSVEKHKTFRYKGELKTGRAAFQVRVWMPRNSAMFRLSRKKARCTDKWNGGHELTREVVRAEHIGRAEAVCITVSSPRGLFVTNDYLVTHNSYLACGLALQEHTKSMILRREGTQLTGIIDEVEGLLGGKAGYNGQDKIWRLPNGRQIEFGSTPNPGDQKKYQGRPHDFLCFDEASNFLEDQVRFLLGWLRTTDINQRCRALLCFNPPTDAEGRWVVDFFGPWLDPKHPIPATPGELRWMATRPGEDGSFRDIEVADDRPFVMLGEHIVYDFDPAEHDKANIIRPMSRTFIPSRVSDNPFLVSTNYMATLQALPEPLRSQMLYGDFQAGVSDAAYQVIPTDWVDKAMARWRSKDPHPEFDSLGVDVARGGADSTVISRRAGFWWDKLIKHPGKDTPTGSAVAGLVIANNPSHVAIHIDVIGVGASPYDYLNDANQQVIGVNGAEKSLETDQSGRLRFYNTRSADWWQMREVLDPQNNNACALPPDRELLVELCAPTWRLRGDAIYVESREELIKRIGRSPDSATAVILARRDTPSMRGLRSAGGDSLHSAARRNYNPLERRNRNRR